MSFIVLSLSCTKLSRDIRAPPSFSGLLLCLTSLLEWIRTKLISAILLVFSIIYRFQHYSLVPPTYSWIVFLCWKYCIPALCFDDFGSFYVCALYLRSGTYMNFSLGFFFQSFCHTDSSQRQNLNVSNVTRIHANPHSRN